MDWDDLRVFLGVARSGSLAEAAKGLRLDPATLSRRIARLERAAGATLFLKSPRGYALTEAGHRLLPHAEGMEARARAGEAALAGGEALRGRVRIGAPDGIANYVLPGVAARIAGAHPGLGLDIVALPRVFDLGRREADLAVTVSPPKAGRLMVRKLCDYRLSLAARRDYLDAHPPIRTRDDLRGHRIVGYIPDMIFDADLDYLGEVGAETPGLASNSASVQLGLLRAGGGIGIVHDFMLPAAPELTRVLPDDVRLTRAYHLTRHRDAAGPLVTRVADLLAEGVRADVARLETE
ncbi:LysR family transcriptional regulator [Jannaschia seohaensis]|uniref:DNA-binding transcriptional LysR family regulator n=1 Tax=Jannaschia seohaensis TaxID=475081 RepID=A0A2Y9AGR1_9RHOB|nr:LysR family transcriptional regulator [Jannaschia seohaensis]PWJ21319.1 DNA-binding transcriptional LysR family regulator [Jannaschia seohaensis]SSA41729.1 DNA-binding transcriptional regulator, LysR family [Jannaschia seohaensis]